jgi:hypothetical protein
VTWPLRFRPANASFNPWTEAAQIGDCWYMPQWDEDAERRQRFIARQASQQYRDQWADKRPPIFVQLPPGWPWCVDEASTGGGDGWTVTGSIEDGTLNVTPSINAIGSYHGYVQNGQVTDDVEGRTFS